MQREAKEGPKRNPRKGKQWLEKGAERGSERATGSGRGKTTACKVKRGARRGKSGNLWKGGGRGAGRKQMTKKEERQESRRRLTFAVALIGDGNGATCAAGGESQVAGTLVGVSVGPANGACGGSLLRGRLWAPAGAPHAVRAQVLVQQAAPALAATDSCARTCSTLYTLLRTVVNRPRDNVCPTPPSPTSFAFVYGDNRRGRFYPYERPGPCGRSGLSVRAVRTPSREKIGLCGKTGYRGR